MNYKFDLFSFEHNNTSKLNEWLNKPVPHEGMQAHKVIGDYLGALLAESILSRHQIPALSVFCWDEHFELGGFQEDAPAIWLAGPLEHAMPGEWKADGYGFKTPNNTRVARWIAWKKPEILQEAFDVYQDISATNNLMEFQQSLDMEMTKYLVCKNRGICISGAFIAVISDSIKITDIILRIAKETIANYLYEHSIVKREYNFVQKVKKDDHEGFCIEQTHLTMH